MPTDNSVQTNNGVAPAVPPAASTQPALTEEFLKTIPYDLLKKAHPDVQNIETRYAAAHKEIDGKKTKKELEAEVARLKVLAGEEPTPAPQSATPSTQVPDLAAMQADIEWNISNKALIQAAGQLYVDNLAKGMDKQDALDLALVRRPSGDKTIAEATRAQAAASSGASTDRSPNPGPEIDGVSKEYIEKMQKQYPNLPQEKLVEMIHNSVSRTRQRGA